MLDKTALNLFPKTVDNKAILVLVNVKKELLKRQPVRKAQGGRVKVFQVRMGRRRSLREEYEHPLPAVPPPVVAQVLETAVEPAAEVLPAAALAVAAAVEISGKRKNF